MKDWSLRAKLIGWSALVVAVALVICGAGAGAYVQQEQIEALDDQIRDEAEMFFAELRQNPGGLDRITRLLPMTPKERFIEVAVANGSRLYRSENLRQELVGFSEGMHRIQIGRHATRLGVFKKEDVTLCIAIDLSEINQDIKELMMGFAGALPVLMGIVILGGWWIARKALGPIQEITTAAEQITAQHLDRRLPVSPSRDEIGRLATVLNETFDRLDRSFRQAARFSADASHELKTPLTILRSGMEDLLESPALIEGDRRAVAALLEQTHRLSGITESLLLLSRADVGRLKLDLALTNVSQIVTACVEDARIIAEPHGIQIEMDMPDNLDAVVDAGRLEQILLNLLDNAVKYNHEGGRIKVSGESARNGNLSILVGNTGPGIAKDHASRLFERFFRSDAIAGVPGSGLGLSLARELARAHGGELILTRSDSEWTEFNLFIKPPNPMKTQQQNLASKTVLSVLLASLAVLSTHTGFAADAPPLVADQPILIPGAHGKFDFIEIDAQASRLLAAHPGNSSLDIFDLNSGKLIKSVSAGVAQDAAIDEKGGRYYVGISAGKKLAAIDRTSFEKVGETALGGPADIVAFDPKNGLTYVGHDDATEVWAVDGAASKLVATIKIPEGPEGIVYDSVNDRVYINSKSGDVVVVVDPATNKEVQSWPVAPATKPHGSAFDAEGKRLFVVGANGKLVAIDVKTGKVSGSVDVANKVDQIAFDSSNKRVYCASGDGVISVVDASGAALKSLGNAPTHKGAHSVAVDEKTHAVWTAYADGDKSYLLRLK